MASYIGKVQITGSDPVLVGSTLYGICTTTASTAAKTVGTTDDNSGNYINNNYDNLIRGTTIHVKFTQGNTVTSGVTLAVGSTLAKNVIGIHPCNAGTILSFTLDESENWVANDNIDTNTEYVFKSTYNASTNRVLGEADVGDAAEKGVVTDLGNNTTSTDLPTAQAVAQYVQAQTGGLSGLTGAMHFRGIATVAVTDGGVEDPTITDYDFRGNGDNAGDVVLYSGKEFVWTGTAWELLGDEGSYALKSSTDIITEVSSFTANTLPTLSTTAVTASRITSITAGTSATLTTTTYTVPIVTTAGTATTASVSAGVLTINVGIDTGLSTTPVTIKGVNEFTSNSPTTISSTAVSFDSVADWDAGSQATLSTASTTVVVPNAATP